MQITYQKYKFNLKLEFPVKIHPFPSFILRSIIGKELRNLTCLFKKKTCEECSLNKQCAYSNIFETPLAKDNEIIKGRNFASHPFILYTEPYNNIKTDRLEFDLTLMGKGIEYLPYFYYAVQKAGEDGIFRERMPFSVENVEVDGKPILEQTDKIKTDNDYKTWEYIEESEKTEEKKVIITLTSPLRYKEEGKYMDTINYKNLLYIGLRLFALHTF